ncbi:MAG: hypothetical protein ACE5HD_00695 [Acidobacteriota bacterium]
MATAVAGLLLGAVPMATTLAPNPLLDISGPGVSITSDGVGLEFLGSGTGTVTVNVGGPVIKAFLYWAGREAATCTESGGDCVILGLDQDLLFDGVPAAGIFMGDEFQFRNGGKQNNIGYLYDVTDRVKLRAPGINSFTIQDGDLGKNLLLFNGASLLVIYTDESDPIEYRVIVHEGLDFAYFPATPDAAKVTIPVQFTYAPASADRVANLLIVGGDAERARPDEITVTDNPTIIDSLDSSSGEAWDNDIHVINIPAGVDSTIVQVVSPGNKINPDSELWTLAVMRLPLVQKVCWMTAGGVNFEAIVGADMAEHGPRDSLGGNVFPGCNPDAGEGGQWNHIAHKEKIHFQGWTVATVACGNVGGIEPGSESPVTPFNFIEFWGTGTIQGIKGNRNDPRIGDVLFFARVEDHNEPGNEKALLPDGGDDIDRYFLQVYTNPGDPNGSTVFLVDVDGDPTTVDPITITGGNLQIHISSCDDPPPF